MVTIASKCSFHNFLCPSLKLASILEHPGLEPQRDLAHFAFSEQGKVRPEAKGRSAAWPELKQDKPRASHQHREEKLQGGGATTNQGML